MSHDNSLASIARREAARVAQCGGSISRRVAPDGSLTAWCTRCGVASTWTADEVAWAGLRAASFPPCERARKGAL